MTAKKKGKKIEFKEQQEPGCSSGDGVTPSEGGTRGKKISAPSGKHKNKSVNTFRDGSCFMASLNHPARLTLRNGIKT